MQTVIDIDDILYTRLFDNGEIDAVDMLKVCIAVRKGVVIPKGHGRLIDANEVIKIANKTKDLHGAIWNTPTIIEADTESEENMTDNEFLLQDRLQKIRQIINKYGEENFYISFSGGKDSTVLSALVDMAVPENKIPRVYANTGI